MLKTYNKIWDEVSNNIEKRCGSETVYNEKYLKTKTKSYKGKINTSFHDDEIAKEGFPCLCLSVILIDIVF